MYQYLDIRLFSPYKIVNYFCIANVKFRRDNHPGLISARGGQWPVPT
jgi:hypothetical protein